MWKSGLEPPNHPPFHVFTELSKTLVDLGTEQPLGQVEPICKFLPLAVPDWAGFEQAVFAMQRWPSFQTMALMVLGANRVGHYGTARLRQSGVGGKRGPKAVQLLMRVIRGPPGAMSLKDSLIRDTMAVPVVAALLIMTLHAAAGVFPGAAQAAEAAGWAGTTASAVLSDYADEIGDRLRAAQSATALVADPSVQGARVAAYDAAQTTTGQQ